jgi:hypothetical protein
MAFQFSTAARNASLDAIETAIGTVPTLELRSGAAPAACATADSGTLLASMALPSDWMAAASAGAKALSGTWQDTAADAAGTVGHFRIKQGATCHLQGSVTSTLVGTGDMLLDNPILALGQQVTVTAFTLNAGGA